MRTVLESIRSDPEIMLTSILFCLYCLQVVVIQDVYRMYIESTIQPSFSAQLNDLAGPLRCINFINIFDSLVTENGGAHKQNL